MAEITIRALDPDEWARFRQIRLQALTTDPDAFCSTVASMELKPDSYWRDQLLAAEGSKQVFLRFAEADGELIGMVRIEVEEEASAGLYSMYVAPEFRGLGVAQRLIAEAIAQVRPLATRIQLEVRPGQSAAVRLYEKCGFRGEGLTDDGNLRMVYSDAKP